MGQRLAKHASRRAGVDERYTKPTGLYVHRNIDSSKLRHLILNGKLAPCWAGVEEPKPGEALEECPICFLVRGRRNLRAARWPSAVRRHPFAPLTQHARNRPARRDSTTRR